MTPEQKRFEELLPFYANGTLPPADMAFMQDYLARNASANKALSFVRHIQKTVQHGSYEQPPAASVERFLNKWTQTSELLQSSDKPKPVTERVTREPSTGERFRAWWIGLAGLGVAAMAVTVLLLPGLATVGVLHSDGLDGKPDLELVLAQNISPDHEIVRAHLKRFNGQIVERSEQDGLHRVSVDLQNRAADQHELIAALQNDGQLKSYTLLATR